MVYLLQPSYDVGPKGRQVSGSVGIYRVVPAMCVCVCVCERLLSGICVCVCFVGIVCGLVFYGCHSVESS